MEIPKQVNGKECQKNILKAIGTFNFHIKALQKWNPEISDEDETHAFVFTLSQIKLARELVAIARMFNIEAEFYDEECFILVEGKLLNYSNTHERPRYGTPGLS